MTLIKKGFFALLAVLIIGTILPQSQVSQAAESEWKVASPGINADMTAWGMNYLNGKFIATGTERIDSFTHRGVVYTSLDGSTWKRSLIDNGPYVPSSLRSTSMRYASYGGNRFVAVGNDGTPSDQGNSGIALISQDGENWTSYRIGTDALMGVAYGQGMHVAVGNKGQIFTLQDGETTWVERSSGVTEQLRSIAYGNGKFVAMSMDGNILNSVNGIDWTPQTKLSRWSYWELMFASGKFITVSGAGSQSSVSTSVDGENWESHNVPGSNGLMSISHDGYFFVATGASGSVAISADGENWKTEISGTQNHLRSVAAGPQGYVTASEGGFVLRRDALPHTVMVTYEPGEHGTIGIGGEHVDIGSNPVGVPVVIPNAGYRFSGWSSDGGVTKLSNQQLSELKIFNDITYTAYYSAPIKGDANGDGKVTSADVLLLNNYIKGKITLKPEQLEALDMNGDGKWDAEDVKAILAIIAGKG